MNFSKLNETARSIRTEGESWKSAVKRAASILKHHGAEENKNTTSAKLTATVTGGKKAKSTTGKKKKPVARTRRLRLLPTGHIIVR